MIRLLWLAALGLAAALLVGAAPPPPAGPAYAEGQVWEYHTRPGEEGSLLKIQKIETWGDAKASWPVYHVSIIGLHFEGLPLADKLRHAPFSKAALDASVTRLSASKARFPDPTEGIEQWRTAAGGVFTVSVADAVAFAEQAIRAQAR